VEVKNKNKKIKKKVKKNNKKQKKIENRAICEEVWFRLYSSELHKLKKINILFFLKCYLFAIK